MFFAFFNELSHPKLFNVLFGFKTELLLNLNLNPQTLIIETILKTLFETAHVLVTLVEIFKSPPPSVVNPHRVVGSNRSIKKGKPFVRRIVAVEIFLEHLVLLPVFQNPVFKFYKIWLGINWLKHNLGMS